MIVGNAHSTPPIIKAKFVFIKTGEDIKVIASQWIETIMAFGQLRQQELRDNNHNNDLQNFLFNIGGV